MIALACLLPQALLTLSAQEAAPIDAAELRARREQLASAVAKAHPGERAVVLLRGANKRADMGRFVQNQNFLYLTGTAEPDVAMLLVVDESGKLVRDELLVPPFSRFSAKWDGRFLAPGEKAAKRTGFAEVGNVRSLHRALDELLAPTEARPKPLLITAKAPAARIGSTPGKAATAARERSRDRFDRRPTREQALLDALTGKHAIEVAVLEDFVHAMRPTKSPAELALLRRSTEIAAEGIGEAMRSVRPGVFEYQLAAIARCVFFAERLRPRCLCGDRRRRPERLHPALQRLRSQSARRRPDRHGLRRDAARLLQRRHPHVPGVGNVHARAARTGH